MFRCTTQLLYVDNLSGNATNMSDESQGREEGGEEAAAGEAEAQAEGEANATADANAAGEAEAEAGAEAPAPAPSDVSAVDGLPGEPSDGQPRA